MAIAHRPRRPGRDHRDFWPETAGRDNA